MDKFVLKRQWQRSSLMGFLRRMWNYKFGLPCFRTECFGKMFLLQRLVTDGIFERWRCNKCGAKFGEWY